jgi:hypothetical protein
MPDLIELENRPLTEYRFHDPLARVKETSCGFNPWSIAKRASSCNFKKAIHLAGFLTSATESFGFQRCHTKVRLFSTYSNVLARQKMR